MKYICRVFALFLLLSTAASAGPNNYVRRLKTGKKDISDSAESGNINFNEEYYKELHGGKDHLREYHPEEETFEKLLEIYKESPALFKSAVDKVYFQNEATSYPRYPDKTRQPGYVESVPTIPEEEQEEFKALYLNRTKECPDYNFAQDVQYPRWEWAVENVDILVNQLRLSGFSDEQITNMFKGLPMWVKDDGIFDEFRRDLSLLALSLEEETELSNVGIVFTGSSVNGFSQNPCKGKEDIPTWMTSAEDSDVDISIHADGVFQLGSDNGWRFFPTTIDENTASARAPIWEDEIPKLGEGAVAFYEKWSNKLWGGLQMTAYESDNRLPPWETRAVYGRRRR